MAILKYYQTFVLVVLLFSSFSCDNENPEPETKTTAKEFYTVTVDPAYTFGGTEENWVFATDKNGELLDGRSFVAGDVVKLESTTTVDKNFNIHFLEVNKKVSGEPYFKLTSYNEVPVAGSWKVVNPLPLSGPIGDVNVTGSMHITLKNYSEQPDILFHQNIKVSGPAGNQISSIVGTSIVDNRTTYDIDVTLLNINNNNLIISFSQYQVPYFAEVPAVPGSVVTLDAFNFDQVDRNITFHLEQSKSVWIGYYGFHTGDDVTKSGYIFSERIDSDGKMFGALGYNDGFDHYKTIISYSQDNYTRTYYKFGEPSPGYYFQSPMTSVSKTGINDFSCIVGVPHVHASFFFHNPTTQDVTWEIVSPRPLQQLTADEKLAVKKIPEALSLKYPSLNLGQLVFKNGSAVQYMDSFTYQDFISFKSNINGATKMNSNEYYYYEWR